MSWFNGSFIVPAARRLELGGYTNKRPRKVSGGERRKLEKRVRLGGRHSPRAEQAGVSLRSSPLGEEKAGTQKAGEGTSRPEEMAVTAEEQRREEGAEGTAEVPHPPVVEIPDSPEEVSSACPVASLLEDMPISGVAEGGAPVVSPEGVPLVSAGGPRGTTMAVGARDVPTMEELPLGESDGADVRSTAAEAKKGAVVAGPLFGEVRNIGGEIEASEEPTGEGRAPATGEGSLIKRGKRGKKVAVGAPSTGASGRLAPGLAELSDEPEVGFLLREAGRVRASQSGAAQAGSSAGPEQFGSSDLSNEAEFSALMRLVLYPGEDPSADQFMSLDLVDAAFGQRNVAKDIHLLPRLTILYL